MKSDALNAKLLVIVSDGRGIFSEGETRVLQAVRRARQQGIFLVYVIIDNPDNKVTVFNNMCIFSILVKIPSDVKKQCSPSSSQPAPSLFHKIKAKDLI